MPDVYYDSTLTGQELDDALRNIPANVRRSETAAANAEKSAKSAESWDHGGTGTRDGEETDNAKYWAQQAKANQTAAAGSAEAAKSSENAAKASADAAKNSQTAAAASETNAAASKTAAAASASAAKTSQDAAKSSETAAKASQTAAAGSVADAAKQANTAKSYAIGQGLGSERPNEATENAQYYFEQAKRISQGLEGALLPMGNITFAGLASATKQAGYMYNVTDAFTTDDTFKEGTGHDYAAGTNVYWTADDKWDALPGIQVTGVKGHAESVYRLGQVDITPANIGLGNVDNTSDREKKVASAGKVEHALTFSGGAAGAYDGSADKTVKIPSTAADVGALPMTGGTLNGKLNVGNKLHMYTDTEGGNIQIVPPDSAITSSGVNFWEMDANSGNLRIFVNTTSGYNFPITLQSDGKVNITSFTDAMAKALFLATHPVGSYYWSSNATSPQTLFGGTWTQVKDRFVLAAGDTYKADATGGAASVTSSASSAANTGSTAISTAQMPSHAHTMGYQIVSASTASLANPGQNLVASGPSSVTTSNNGTAYTTLAKDTFATGSGQGHTHTMAHTHSVNTMPPYIVAYCWRRTA